MNSHKNNAFREISAIINRCCDVSSFIAPDGSVENIRLRTSLFRSLSARYEKAHISSALAELESKGFIKIQGDIFTTNSQFFAEVHKVIPQSQFPHRIDTPSYKII